MGDHREVHCNGTVHVVFWKRHLASDRENADSAQVSIFFPGNGHYVQWTYEWPKGETQVESDLHALTRVYEAGKQERSREITALLGVKS